MVKNTGGRLDSLRSGILFGKYILEFFKPSYSTFFVSFLLNCQMRNLGENQNLFQILLIKVKRDMFFFPFNKNYFDNPPERFFI